MIWSILRTVSTISWYSASDSPAISLASASVRFSSCSSSLVVHSTKGLGSFSPLLTSCPAGNPRSSGLTLPDLSLSRRDPAA